MSDKVFSTTFTLTAIVDGEDAVSLDVSPAAIVWNQEGEVSVDESTGNTKDNSSWPVKYVSASVMRGDNAETGWTFGYSIGSGCSLTVKIGKLSSAGAFSEDKTGNVFQLSSPAKTRDANGKEASDLWTNGSLKITATKDGKQLAKDVHIALNALATWKMSVVNGTMSAVSKKTETQVNGKLKTYETRLTQNEKEIKTKVSQADVDKTVSTSIEQSEKRISLSVASRKNYRNLLQGTDFNNPVAKFQISGTDNGNTVEISSAEKYDDTKSLHVKTAVKENYTGIYFRPVMIKRNTKYHFSLLAKGKGTIWIESIYQTSPVRDSSARSSDRPSIDNNGTTLTEDWKLYQFDFTTNDKYDSIELNVWTNDDDADLYIARPMLEEGTEYTGWSLSPEDPTIEDKLVETGIDIEKNKIEAKTGRFDFVGLDGKVYIRVEQDGQGIPHFVFYNKAGTAMYDLGYTGIFDLIQGSDKQSWVKYIGVVATGNTIACATLVGSFTMQSGSIADAKPISRTIYEYHSAKFTDGSGETKYYHSNYNYWLFDSDSVNSSDNNAPTGQKVISDNMTSGYLYEIALAVDNSTASTKITTYTIFAHHIVMDAVNDANGRYKNDYIKIEVEKSGVQVGNGVSVSYRWRINGGGWTVGNTLTIS